MPGLPRGLQRSPAERPHGLKYRLIYALAKQLNRDYKNVHGDVAVLMNLGVIAKDADGRVSVPYDEIEARLPLGAAA